MVKEAGQAVGECYAESEEEVGEEAQKARLHHLRSSEEEAVELLSLGEVHDYEMCLVVEPAGVALGPKRD